MRTLAPDLLKTLVAFADTGSLTRAAKAVGRTASAVTAHVQRLEADVGAPLLAPAGRGRTQGLRMKFCVGLARGSSAIQPGA